MIYSTDFKEMAGKISHVNVAKYLTDLGWNEIESKREYTKIFQFEQNSNFFQVNLPIERNLLDYNIAMYRVVENIADSVNKSVEQVLLELLNPLSDILRVCVKDKQVESGSIFVEDAIKLYDNAKKLLMATAMDIINPKLIHLGRPDSKIQEFVSSCRFGQTEIGSYVVSLVCPISKIENGQFQQLSLFSEEDECANSLTRKVTNKLILSVKVVKESIDNGTFDDVIFNGINSENPISSNFLEALSAMSIYKSDSELDLTAKYAPTIKSNVLPFNKVSINHDYFEPIDIIINKIKNAQEEEKVYIGRISKLHATPDADKRESGIVTLVFIGENENKTTASVNLRNDDYELAIEAHRKGKNVKVVGSISGQKSKRIDCSIFEVVN